MINYRNTFLSKWGGKFSLYSIQINIQFLKTKNESRSPVFLVQIDEELCRHIFVSVCMKQVC